MELLVTRKSLKVVLQGHFSGYPSHKTYTGQKKKAWTGPKVSRRLRFPDFKIIST
jgi:hypothetical protein